MTEALPPGFGERLLGDRSNECDTKIFGLQLRMPLATDGLGRRM